MSEKPSQKKVKSESDSERLARLRKEARIQPFLVSHLTFRYWRGPLHYMDIEPDEDATKVTKILYGDHPDTEMIFICDRRGKVMELRNESDQLSLNALTATVHDKDHVDMLVRELGKDGTLNNPSYILQRLVTEKISREAAREMAKKWLPLNPYVGKGLVEFGLLYPFEAEDQSITLEDFEIRYKNLREAHPNIGTCSVVGCNNPRETTPYGGEDSTCAYHRLLFDAWSYGLDDDKRMYYWMKQQARRLAFTKWRNKLGEKTCDELVLKLAQEAINWAC